MGRYTGITLKKGKGRSKSITCQQCMPVRSFCFLIMLDYKFGCCILFSLSPFFFWHLTHCHLFLRKDCTQWGCIFSFWLLLYNTFSAHLCEKPGVWKTLKRWLARKTLWVGICFHHSYNPFHSFFMFYNLCNDVMEAGILHGWWLKGCDDGHLLVAGLKQS